MKILILEGIATCGKTTVKNELKKILSENNHTYLFVDEEETLIPVLHNKNPQVSSEYIFGLLQKYISSGVDILIFERMYITHIWRTGGDLEYFTKVQELLSRHQTLICFLKIPDEKISERIKEAMSYRDKSWNSYVKSKGERDEEIFFYYIKQQDELLTLLNTVSISYKIFGTGNLDFSSLAMQVYRTQF